MPSLVSGLLNLIQALRAMVASKVASISPLTQQVDVKVLSGSELALNPIDLNLYHID